MQRFWVTSKGFKYSVNVGHGAWRAFADFPHDGYSAIFILTEKPLWERWGKKISPRKQAEERAGCVRSVRRELEEHDDGGTGRG